MKTKNKFKNLYCEEADKILTKSLVFKLQIDNLYSSVEIYFKFSHITEEKLHSETDFLK